MKKSKLLVVASSILMGTALAACGGAGTSVTPKVSYIIDENNPVYKVIKEAQTLEAKELYKKAMEEINGKEFTGIGNSSRGKTAKEYFINYLKGLDKDGNVSEKIRAEFPYYSEDFSCTINWTQPKENSIFTMIDTDIKASNHTISMTLIQDANQIAEKEINTGNFYNYIPKEWTGEDGNKEPFALQSLNKIFEFNNLGNKTFTNCWDFVRTGETPMFMAPDSEPVGRNWLIMLTNKKYSDILMEAANALTGDEKTRIEREAADLAGKATEFKLDATSGKYGLAFAKLWLKQYAERTDDGPICNELVTADAAGASACIVYSKLRSITESDTSSKRNVTVAAYQDGYKGIGGYMYKHYLQVLKTSPFPWTSCAFIHFMTCTYDGFAAWGKDIGGYCSNTTPGINQDHSNDGGTEFPVLNDKGYDWWTGTGDGKGNLVIEDGAYCAANELTVGTWLDTL
ncbi:MAG: hypothetical protein K5694_01110 [Bacilli bacterium]|nr:hypothetical protein [Bacilli bacterium]